MSPLLCALALAQDAPWDAPLSGPAVAIDDRGLGRVSTAIAPTPAVFGVQGVAIEEIGGQSGLTVEQASVVGVDGGTHAFVAHGQVAWDDYRVDVEAPFVAYRTDDGRRGDLGNLAAAVWWTGGGDWQVGARYTARTGGAWTWANEAGPLWPEHGVDAMYLRAFGERGWRGAVRAAAGIHLPAGWEPYPRVYARAALGGLLDREIARGVGLVGEMDVAYWDVSPVDVSAMLRVEPVDRLRARVGWTLPVAAWAGWQPADVPSGIREATFRLELQLR